MCDAFRGLTSDSLVWWWYRHWQSVPYRLDEQAEVVGHLMQSAQFHSVDSAELYALSWAREPKTK